MDELQQSQPKKRNGGRNFIVLIAIALFVVIYLIFFNNPQSVNEDETVEGNETETITADPVEVIDIYSSEGIIPPEWSEYDYAIKNIQTLDEGQEIFGKIILDPTDSNVVYFASLIHEADKNNETSLVSIYRYLQDDHSFERLFRKTYESGDFSLLESDGVPVFNLVSYDSGELIILASIIGASAGPCTEPIILGTNPDSELFTLISMPIDSPYSGFEEYTPSDEIISAAKDRAAECEANF